VVDCKFNSSMSKLVRMYPLPVTIELQTELENLRKENDSLKQAAEETKASLKIKAKKLEELKAKTM
jgi:hypothetical protein